MDFTYDDEQDALREAVSGLLQKAYSGEQRRSVTATDPGFDEKTWSRLAEMGVLGLPFAEEDGGVGAGPVEVAIVAEEIGKVLAPEPFVETVDGGRAAKVAFDGTPATLLGEGTTDRTGDIGRALAAARIAYANEAVGAMDTALRMTTEYLKTRKQFGVTLNKFQALTFRAADMYVSLELARSSALWAVLVQDRADALA